MSERRTLLVVLGMHRSGTSAVTGMLKDYGVALGPARTKRNAFNPRGNREILALRRLHERVLERGGGSWCDPPDAVEVTDADRRDRDEVLAAIEGDVVAVKDPRMLLAMELWRDLDPAPIGVIRNPVAVRDSLAARAAKGGGPVRTPAAWEELWRHYNRVLLAEHERRAFPLVDFDRRDELVAQVKAALAAHGVIAAGESEFFDASLTTPADDDWRGLADAQSVELWDRLRGHAVMPA